MTTCCRWELLTFYHLTPELPFLTIKGTKPTGPHRASGEALHTSGRSQIPATALTPGNRKSHAVAGKCQDMFGKRLSKHIIIGFFTQSVHKHEQPSVSGRTDTGPYPHGIYILVALASQRKWRVQCVWTWGPRPGSEFLSCHRLAG